jgi:hypothetical protein
MGMRMDAELTFEARTEMRLRALEVDVAFLVNCLRELVKMHLPPAVAKRLEAEYEYELSRGE